MNDATCFLLYIEWQLTGRGQVNSCGKIVGGGCVRARVRVRVCVY